MQYQSSLMTKLLITNAGLGASILRIVVGFILSAHGAQKLFGWFGGYGLEGTGQFMASLGLEPGVLMAILSGSAEFFGGLLLMLGLLTRPAALINAFVMLMAIFTVHFANGLFMSNNGYEFALTLLAATVALAIQGGGKFSFDQYLTRTAISTTPGYSAATAVSS